MKKLSIFLDLAAIFLDIFLIAALLKKINEEGGAVHGNGERA
jgi:hypothetical protein